MSIAKVFLKWLLKHWRAVGAACAALAIAYAFVVVWPALSSTFVHMRLILQLYWLEEVAFLKKNPAFDGIAGGFFVCLIAIWASVVVCDHRRSFFHGWEKPKRQVIRMATPDESRLARELQSRKLFQEQVRRERWEKPHVPKTNPIPLLSPQWAVALVR
jgi:hypothetical protein